MLMLVEVVCPCHFGFNSHPAVGCLGKEPGPLPVQLHPLFSGTCPRFKGQNARILFLLILRKCWASVASIFPSDPVTSPI
jgi:hypothetical protein